MTASYKKLWKLLIDRDLMKKDLEAMAGISLFVKVFNQSIHFFAMLNKDIGHQA